MATTNRYLRPSFLGEIGTSHSVDVVSGRRQFREYLVHVCAEGRRLSLPGCRL